MQDEEDEEEEEEEQDQGTSLITSQAARNHVFPILVNELVKESILTSKQVCYALLLCFFFFLAQLLGPQFQRRILMKLQT